MEAGMEPQAAVAAGEASAAVEDMGRAEEATEGEEARSEGAEDEALLLRTQRLISKINASQENPNPRDLHALASILETQESRYVKESGSSNVARSSHAIGKLSNLVRENDEFYELISSRFLSESRYSISIRAASARNLLSCPSTGMYPHVFDATVLDNFKTWVMEDSIEPSAVACNWKHELGRSKPTDFEMLKTYATGLLAMSLAGGAKVVEDILTSGLSAKLMRYLRMQILGEASSSQKDISSQAEARHHAGPTSARGREENKGRPRQVLDGLRLVDECLPVDQNVERDRDKITGVRQAREVECRGDVGELLKSELSASSTDVNIYELIDGEGDGVDDNGWDNMDLLDGKSRFGERQVARSAHEDVDESVRDDSARRRTNRGWPRPRGKGRIPEGTLESERPLLSPSSGLRLGELTRSSTDRNRCKVEGSQKVLDGKNSLISTDSFCSNTEEDNDDRLVECLIGSMDISDIVKKATGAAEAEARAANAPTEAVRAARDAAAELVKSAALEVWKNTNDVETAVLAASKAASTVVDAAMATKALRSSLETNNGLMESKTVKCKVEEEPEEFFILDVESLAHLREKYCILCLEILGEYVEALGPVLHEKGVDVCLALLQRCSSDGETTDNFGLLPEVLKLICALAAHKKFAALFVDRGGMQKLLAVPTASHTSVGLSSCLFTIGSLQGVMERVCASDYVSQVVALTLKLLECSQEIARKNAAIFFSGAFVFRAILDSFDAQDGMQKMLNLLQGAASVRSGGSSGVLGLPSANLQNDRSPSEVLSSQEKAIAYHTCVALRQYFRAHLLMLVDSLRPNKSSKNVARGSSSARAAYKPLDISNEAMDVVFRQIQRDRKLGSAFVRARWPAIDKFLSSNGHLTMLELCQAPTLERYLHDLAQYALGVLHIVTLVPYGRKLIVNATLSNDRVGMAIILDAANGAGYVVDPEVIQTALNVIVNLVCPPPSISTKPSMPGPSQLPASSNMANGSAVENKERHLDRSMSERNYTVPTANETRESNISDRGTGISTYSLQTSVPAMPSGVVGDRRICLGPGAGCAGLAAQLEQGYRQAREAVRANNGIKVLLHLLHPRMITPPQALDCIRALACRVLLGLARDETIAHILTKLQVGKKLSELIRDFGSQASGNEQKRWQTELTQVAIELIAIVTNSGRASTLAATDAAAPTLRRIERAAIAAATPITYHSRELLLLIHEHLQVSGLFVSAAALQKEAELTPLPSLLTTPTLHQISIQETSSVHIHWPSGRASGGFLSDFIKPVVREEDANPKTDSAPSSSRKKALVFASNLAKNQSSTNSSSTGVMSASSKSSVANTELDISQHASKCTVDLDSVVKTPIVLPMKRKFVEVKDPSSTTPTAKRLAMAEFSSPPGLQNSSFGRRNSPAVDGNIQYSIGSLTPRSLSNRLIASSIPVDNDDTHLLGTSGAPVSAISQSSLPGEQFLGNTERMTLDSLVVQYLKHQHRQCPAPITTLPPLSLLHSHVCPEPSRSLNAPANVTARVGTCELGKQHRGIHTSRRDRQFVYSRFRPCRTCRDDVALLTSITFLGNSYHIATGSHSGELKIFDTSNGNVLESYAGHQTPIPMVQSSLSVDTQLILSSGSFDVKLWDASSVSNGPFQTFDGCKTARFSHAGTSFAALSTDASSREVLLYDIQTCNVELKLSDTSSNPSGIGRGHTQSLIHFSPLDTMLLWNGVLWDRRSAGPLHRFDQFTDYGGGGFHPSGNEVILNSEVWDLRKFKLLRSVPSLDQTVITFSSGGDVIYAILRRNLEDVTSAVNTRRGRHPLFPAFRTIDATNYCDIATVQVDRCVLDFAADPTDSYVGVIAMDDHEDMFSSARLYEIGRRRPTDDDSDPDDGGDTDDEEDEEDDTDADIDEVLGGESDIEGDSDSEDASNDEDDEDIESGDEMDEEADFNLDDVELEGGQGVLEIIAGSDDGEEDDSGLESYSSDGEGDFSSNGFGF